MTPAARIAAAIEILDAWRAGTSPERALTEWGRAHRFAGSGDRNAIRDHVYDALRCVRSFAWAGGAETGRGLMLGMLRLAGRDPAEVFTGDRFAPPPVGPEETGHPLDEAPDAVRLDCPDWLLPRMQASLGDATETALEAGRHRAPVWLRVNALRASRDEAAAALAAEGIATRPHPDINSALEATENARKISSSRTYVEGVVELQDASSQAVVAALGALEELAVLDYCAGAGGKALHLAAEGARVTAHDVDPARMRDLGPRAERAGVSIATAERSALPALGPWPLVLVDAPCSGSGTWRRDPAAKWRLTSERLEELTRIQTGLLAEVAPLVAPGGRIAYVTCSVLTEETTRPAAAFLAGHPGWEMTSSWQTPTGPGGDGFSLAILRRV